MTFKTTLFIVVVCTSLVAQAQSDSLFSKLKFNADFRFRLEQDWNSRTSDGSFREDRSRMRYRVRAGATYKGKKYEVGLRLRTGNPRKQQDPQLTLGDGSKEFGTLPIGFEKAYLEWQWNAFRFFVGKNTFPFQKSNELFWSDNVYPEGVSIQKHFEIQSAKVDHIQLTGGHYIIATSNTSLDKDTYFQGFQVASSFFEERFTLFPSIYLFQNIPNIPDGNDTFLIDYSILHIGTAFKILQNTPLTVEVDYYQNLQDYSKQDSISTNLQRQKTGVVIGLKYGGLAKKGDWFASATYNHLERFAAVDFLAQNDWARWDYSAFDSPDGRLTNLNGIELVAGYKLTPKINLIAKYYFVEQLVPLGIAIENGSRIRFDVDIAF